MLFSLFPFRLCWSCEPFPWGDQNCARVIRLLCGCPSILCRACAVEDMEKEVGSLTFNICFGSKPRPPTTATALSESWNIPHGPRNSFATCSCPGHVHGDCQDSSTQRRHITYIGHGEGSRGCGHSGIATLGLREEATSAPGAQKRASCISHGNCPDNFLQHWNRIHSLAKTEKYTIVPVCSSEMQFKPSYTKTNV